MRLSLEGLGDLRPGLQEIGSDHGIVFDENGLRIQPHPWDRPELRIERQGRNVDIFYRDRAAFFRGVGLLVERPDDPELVVVEQVAFSRIGPMIDVSQGDAVPKPEVLRELIRKMSVMGLNLLMLYCEDSYEVPGEPYFGYMRGRLRISDMRALDDYAFMFGVELVPCIQTLGHMYDILKWSRFAAVRDDQHTLLVGEPATYELIDEMIAAAAAPVRTRRIHIGMDEAWNLGLGSYLTRRGYHPKIEIMREHLPRVLEIVERHGLEPMMWSDMFFRATSPTNAYDRGGQLTEAARSAVPEKVDLVYWSYHNQDQQFYQDWLDRHIDMGRGRPPVFAGGISNWRGWGPNYGMTLAATRAALAACKNAGVTEVLATLWGDDGTECDLEASLLGLQFYAETCYGGDNSDDALRRRFSTCVGGQADDFIRLKDVDETPGVPATNPESCNPSEYLLWQNPMMGLFDENIRDLPMTEHYQVLSVDLAAAGRRNPGYESVFGLYEKLCRALAAKAELGLRLTDAYRDRDVPRLRALLDEDLPTALHTMRELRDAHLHRWHEVYQPFGWEVMDTRYGSAILALETAQWRLAEYLDGRVEQLEELEEPRLPFDGNAGQVSCQYVGKMQSASRLYWDVG